MSFCWVSFLDWAQILWERLQKFLRSCLCGSERVFVCVFDWMLWVSAYSFFSSLVCYLGSGHTDTHREPACIWEVSARGCDLMAPVVPELPPGCLVTLYSGFVQVLTQVNSSYFCCANSNYSWLLFWSHLSINRYQWQKLHWCGGRHRYGYYGVGQGGEPRWALGRLGTRKPGRARTCATRPLTTATPRSCTGQRCRDDNQDHHLWNWYLYEEKLEVNWKLCFS